ncbi:MFS transporter [Bartonella henselae]|uniref:MFS transporter n=1 Tax=Bartonella henselae TaxID=38323 RepID=UPI00095F19F4|nr:MFS transporter [Bartonella henselae]OLL54602.1 ABC transporter permease [Bartonella henselae]OLL56268.1 ABC transporter permease [Bartonella henselae]UJM33256.1 MFS transporter [Bartonella henselae]
MKKQNWSALLWGENSICFLTFTGGVVLHATNVYIVVTILPSLMNDIGSELYYSWVVIVFITASLLGTSLATKILVKIGPRKAYFISCLIFIVGTFTCSIASNMPLFLIGRFVQGFGSGSLLSLSYSMIRIIFNPSLWSHALSVISGMWGISTLLGPAIGGISVQYGVWRVSFWIIGTLAIIFSLIALKVLPKENKNDIPTSPLPLPQLFILTLLIFIISAGGATDTTITKICGLIIGLSLLFVLAKIELSTLHPMLPRKSFSFSSEFFPVYALILIMTTIVYSTELYFPLFLQELHGQDPLTAGYIAALMNLGWTCGALLSADVSAKKIRRIIVYSPILSLLGVCTLLWLIPTEVSTPEYIFIICLALFTIGVSAGIAWPHLLKRILQCANDEDSLRASESLTSVQLFSGALSATVAGTITNLSGLLDPGGIIGMTLAAKTLLAVLISLLFCLGIPFALRVSYSLFKNPTGQSKN